MAYSRDLRSGTIQDRRIILHFRARSSRVHLVISTIGAEKGAVRQNLAAAPLGHLGEALLLPTLDAEALWRATDRQPRLNSLPAKSHQAHNLKH